MGRLVSNQGLEFAAEEGGQGGSDGAVSLDNSSEEVSKA